MFLLIAFLTYCSICLTAFFGCCFLPQAALFDDHLTNITWHITTWTVNAWTARWARLHEDVIENAHKTSNKIIDRYGVLKDITLIN